VNPVISGTSTNSFGILRHRDEGPYCKNMSFRTWRFLVVESDRAIGAKIIGVSRLGGMPALHSIHPPARDYLSLSIQHEINLFCHFVMMGKIRPARREVHQEKVSDGIGRVDPVAHPRVRSDQKFVQDGLRMTVHRLFLQFAKVSHH